MGILRGIHVTTLAGLAWCAILVFNALVHVLAWVSSVVLVALHTPIHDYPTMGSLLLVPPTPLPSPFQCVMILFVPFLGLCYQDQN